MKTKIISFIENENQLLSVTREYGAEVLMVAMKPEVDFRAAEMGLKHVSIEDFYDSALLMTEGSNNFTEQEDFCKCLDRILEESFSGVCSKGFFSAEWFIFMFKRLRDSLYYKAVILTAAFDQLNPEKVICFPFSEDRLVNIGNYGHWTKSSESIALNICQDRQCEIAYLKEKNIDRVDIKTKWGRRTSLIGYGALALNRFFKFVNVFKGNLNYKFKGGLGLPVIAISQLKNGLFDFEDAAKLWGRSGGKVINLVLAKYLYNISPYRFIGKDRLNYLGINQKSLGEFWRSLSDRQEFKSWFRFKGIDCFPVAQTWLKDFITRIIPEFISYSAYLEDMFWRKRVGLFICTAIADPIDVAEVIAARRSSAKVISSEHGGIGSLFLPIYECQDYRPADFSFRYGYESVRIYNDEFKANKESNSCVLSAVGSVPLTKMFIKERSRSGAIPKKQKTLLYVPTGLVGDQLYFAWNHYPDIWYWRFLKDVVDLLGTYTDVKVFFKEYPFDSSRNPIKDYAQARSIVNISFIPTESPTEENLWRADLIVMDFPSTSLMGALCTRKPVILFYDQRWLKMANSGRDLLKKRVELCTNKEDFLSIIREWCDKPSWPEIRSPDDSYLKAFGIIDKDHIPAQEQIRQINKLFRIQSDICKV